jgi:hypothetical protein
MSLAVHDSERIRSFKSRLFIEGFIIRKFREKPLLVRLLPNENKMSDGHCERALLEVKRL